MKDLSSSKRTFSFLNSLITKLFYAFLILMLITNCTSNTENDVLAIASDQFGPNVTQGQQLTTTDFTNEKPLIPSDIYRDKVDPSVPPNHEDLATFAWLEFISLVSQSSNERGVPGGSFSQSGAYTDITLNWQTYHHRAELFPYRSNRAPLPPTPWNSTPEYHMSYKDDSSNTVPYDVPFNLYTNLDEASQISENLLFFPAIKGQMAPLNDFQALYEAKVNKVSWNYVNNNYTTLNDISPDTYPNGITLPDNTVHLKATWKPLASIPESEHYKYFIHEGIYYTGKDSNPIAKTKMFALIGLHIIHKTKNYPAFIFSTFEHIDNLKGGTYYVPTYKYIEIALPDSVPTFNGDSLYSPNPFPANFTKKPYAVPNGNQVAIPNYDALTIDGSKRVPVGDGKYVIVVPVKKPYTTNNMVANVNNRALELMKKLPGFSNNFIWQYYQLKGVQGVPTSNDTSPDFYLASNVTESSAPGLQLFRGGQSINLGDNIDTGFTIQNRRNELNVLDTKQGTHYFNMGGCQGCHGISKRLNGFDFSFLYFGAAVGYQPDVIGIKEREEIINLLMKFDLSKRRTNQHPN